MTGEDEGVAYLRALKRPGSPQPATTSAAVAAAPARNVAPGGAHAAIVGSQQPHGSEKRRSPRYTCEGSAELQEEGRDVRTWVTFTDVSLHGCYVEAQATYPTGVVLHLKLEANGVRVDVKGSVRVSYPYLGMGIGFVEMSDDTRARLRELLGTVSRPAMIMGSGFGPGIAPGLSPAKPSGTAPTIADPAAAIRSLVAFFEERHMLTREDFLQVLAKSQSAHSNR